MLSQKQIDAAIQADLPRHHDIGVAFSRYEGDWPDTLRPAPSDPRGADNIPANLSKIVVNTLAHYLFGNGIEFEVGDEQRTAEDEWLRDFWDENDQEEFLTDLAVSGSIAGDGFVMIAGGGEYPTLSVLDPQTVSVITDPLNYKRPLAFVISATAKTGDFTSFSDGTTRFQTIVEQGDGQWWITQRVAEAFRNQFAVQGEPVLWPYDFCPIFHVKNLPCPHSYWGQSDLGGDVQKLNQAINFALSNGNRVTRLHAHPKMWAKNVSSDSEIDMSPDTITILEGEDAQLAQIAASSSTADHVTYVGLLRDLFHQISSVPEIAAGKLENIGQLSGLALKILYGPLVRVIETKRGSYGKMLQEISRRALQMQGYEDLKARDITIQWPDLLPTSEQEVLEAAKAKRDLGVSQDTILRELSYDPDVEKQKRDAEQPATTPTPAQPPLAVTPLTAGAIV